MVLFVFQGNVDPFYLVFDVTIENTGDDPLDNQLFMQTTENEDNNNLFLLSLSLFPRFFD